MLAKLTHRKQSGFTIVELLIVIVIIGILAAITIVAYNGIQARARDSQIESAANQIEKSIRIFHINTGNQPYSGSQSTGAVTNKTCPGSTTANGFVGKPSYNCTLEDLLLSDGLIPHTLIPSLPPNKGNTGVGYPRHTFMFYQCGVTANNSYALYWYLENPTPEDTTNFDNIRAQCGSNVQIRDSWGMRAGRIIQL